MEAEMIVARCRRGEYPCHRHAVGVFLRHVKAVYEHFRQCRGCGVSAVSHLHPLLVARRCAPCFKRNLVFHALCHPDAGRHEPIVGLVRLMVCVEGHTLVAGIRLLVGEAPCLAVVVGVDDGEIAQSRIESLEKRRLHHGLRHGHAPRADILSVFRHTRQSNP